MARKTLASVYIDGVLVPAGSGSDHELAKQITNPAAWDAPEPAEEPVKASAAGSTTKGR